VSRPVGLLVGGRKHSYLSCRGLGRLLLLFPLWSHGFRGLRGRDILAVLLFKQGPYDVGFQHVLTNSYRDGIFTCHSGCELNSEHTVFVRYTGFHEQVI
jgi:hypothetical protein